MNQKHGGQGPWPLFVRRKARKYGAPQSFITVDNVLKDFNIERFDHGQT